MVKYTWDHIHLRTANPEATAQWYERMLGAEVVRSMQQGKPRIDLKLGGANIFIAPVAAGDGVNPPPVTPYQGLDHFGLTVSGIDAVDAELKAKGGFPYPANQTPWQELYRSTVGQQATGACMELATRYHDIVGRVGTARDNH